jgi:hypothetical protein
MYWYLRGHKDSVGIYFRSLGFTLHVNSAFASATALVDTQWISVVRIATHSVCFLVCRVAFVLASTVKALTA